MRAQKQSSLIVTLLREDQAGWVSGSKMWGAVLVYEYIHACTYVRGQCGMVRTESHGKSMHNKKYVA